MSSMSCCGRQRKELSVTSVGGADQTADVKLSYGGVQPILVKGAFTGSLYRFAPGVTQRVHPADAPFMVAIPGLRLGDPSQ